MEAEMRSTKGRGATVGDALFMLVLVVSCGFFIFWAEKEKDPVQLLPQDCAVTTIDESTFTMGDLTFHKLPDGTWTAEGCDP